MRERKKWDGCSYGKTTPSLEAYPQILQVKNRKRLFFFV